MTSLVGLRVILLSVSFFLALSLQLSPECCSASLCHILCSEASFMVSARLLSAEFAMNSFVGCIDVFGCFGT